MTRPPCLPRALLSLPLAPCPLLCFCFRPNQADDVYVTSERGGKIFVSGLPDAMKKLATVHTETVYQRKEESRLPEETLTLESTAGTTEYGAQFMYVCPIGVGIEQD